MSEKRIEERLEAHSISRVKQCVFELGIPHPNVSCSLVSDLKTLFDDIEEQAAISTKQISRSLERFFYKLCDEQPGVVAVRCSFDSFKALIALETRRHEMNSSDSDSDWSDRGSVPDTHRNHPPESSIPGITGTASISEHEGSLDSLSSSESESAEVDSRRETALMRLSSNAKSVFLSLGGTQRSWLPKGR